MLSGQEIGVNYTWYICSTLLPLSSQLCQDSSLCEIFNPTATTCIGRLQCPVGNLTARHGPLTINSARFNDSELNLFGQDSIVGRSLVIQLPGGDRACANIDLDVSSVTAVALLRGSDSPIVGNVWFTDFLTSATTTLVYVDVFGSSVVTDQNWLIRQNPTSSGDCSNLGSVYDPMGLGLTSDCSNRNQFACAIGNLTEKNGLLSFQNSVSQALFHDLNLPIVSNGGENSITNHSLSLGMSDTATLSCANILLLPPRSAVATFNVNGVAGTISFMQATPFEHTRVRVDLRGLNMMAGGYHVHKWPVGSTQTDCGSRITGGHFNPLNADPDVNSTRDEYEVGDLSGKFGSLSSFNEINSSYTDPYIPLFGENNVVGRSIVIHFPNGLTWVCANLTYERPTISLVVRFNQSGVVGRVVMTQLQDDPLAETVLNIQFEDFPEVVAPSTSLTQSFTAGPTSSSLPGFTSVSTTPLRETTSSIASFEGTPSFVPSTVGSPSVSSSVAYTTSVSSSAFVLQPSSSGPEVTTSSRLVSSSLSSTPVFTPSSGIFSSSFQMAPTSVSLMTSSRSMLSSSSALQMTSAAFDVSSSRSFVVEMPSQSSSTALELSMSTSAVMNGVLSLSSTGTSTSMIAPTTSQLSLGSSVTTSLTPSLTMVADTPTPSTMVTDTPTPSSTVVADTPTPSSTMISDAPTPSFTKVVDTPTPSSMVADTPTPTTASIDTSVLAVVDTTSTSVLIQSDQTSSSVYSSSQEIASSSASPSSSPSTSSSPPSASSSPSTSASPSPSPSTSSSPSPSASSSPSTSASPSPSPSNFKRRRSPFLSGLFLTGLQSARGKRQTSNQPVSWSVRSSCDEPLQRATACSRERPLACDPGDLEGKHGPLTGGQPQVITDPYLPLSGPGSSEYASCMLDSAYTYVHM